MEAVKAIGWLVAAVAVVVAVMLGMQVGRLQRQLEVLEAEVGAMQAETSRTRGQLEQTRDVGLPPAPVESPDVDAVTEGEAEAEAVPEAPPAPALPIAPEPAPAPVEAPAEPTASSNGQPSEASLDERVARAQMVALENALVRMQDALDADQYDAVARFVDVAGSALGNMAAQ